MGDLPTPLRLTENTIEALRREADRQKVAADAIAEEAIGWYLERQEFQRRVMRDRIAEADRGAFVSEEAMTRWVESWGTANELPPPGPDILPQRQT